VRVVLRPEPVRRARPLLWIQRALFAGAISMLLYCGIAVTNSWLFQKQERGELDRLLIARQTLSPSLPETMKPPAIDGLIGRIEIERLGISVMVMEGADSATLRRAAGHIPGTSLPGQPGNVGISAHRDTFFRPLRNVRQNDIVRLTTLGGVYRYRVVSTKIVDPSNTAVLNPSGSEVLTLVTCYPFYYIGPAPDRFIVRAERVI
jgi:sortase A